MELQAYKHRTRDTQVQAYKDVLPTLPRKRGIVFSRILGSMSGMSSYEIEEATGWGQQIVSGRIAELADQGLIEDSGMRRSGRYGKPIVVWKAVEGPPRPRQRKMSYEQAVARLQDREERLESIVGQIRTLDGSRPDAQDTFHVLNAIIALATIN